MQKPCSFPLIAQQKGLSSNMKTNTNVIWYIAYFAQMKYQENSYTEPRFYSIVYTKILTKSAIKDAEKYLSFKWLLAYFTLTAFLRLQS